MLQRGDSFLACFPMFAPVPGDRKVETTNPKDLAPVVLRMADGEQVLVFFTDEDLVNRYLARVDPALEAYAVRFTEPRALLDYLESVPKELMRAAIDVPARTSGRATLFLISEMIETLRQACVEK
jgi:hypothetical protein